MSSPYSAFRSLNIHVPWTELSAVLNLDSSSQTFPVQTQCPFCSGDRLKVYQDNTTRGEWHYCFDCGHSGDMVELAAAVWQLSIPETVLRLAHEGLPIPSERMTPEVIDTYMHMHLGIRSRTLKLWHRAQHRLVVKPTTFINGIRVRLGIHDSLSRERQIKGPAMLFGVATRTELLETFCPGTEKDHSPFSDILSGRGWGDTLLIPYFSAPNQITAFMFVGRDAGKTSRVYRYNPTYSSAGIAKECGLAGLQVSIDHPANYVVAMEDPFLMLRLQMRNFNASLTPLPLVAWRHDTKGCTSDAWATLNGKQLIFWATQPTAELVFQCYKTDGYLSLMGPQTSDRKTTSHYLRMHQPADLMRKIRDKAVPWLEAVSSWMSRADEAAVSKLMSRMLVIHEPLVRILRDCVHASRPAPQHELLLRRIRINSSSDILERGDCWYLLSKGKERRILNATLRVERIITHADSEVYQGYISQRRTHTPFSVSVEPAKNAKAVTKAILDYGRSVGLRFSDEDYAVQKTNLLQIAKAFYPPTELKAQTAGWDGTKFLFKNLQIHPGGQVSANNPALLPDDCPGTQFKDDFKLTRPLAIRLTLPYQESEVVWAITTSVLASILAQKEGLQVQTTLLSGKGLQGAYGTILGRLGVPSKTLNKSSVAPYNAVDPRWAHNWPCCISVKTYSIATCLPRWLLETEFRNICTFVDVSSAQILLMHGGFQQVAFGGVLKPRMLSFIPIEYFIPGYLRFAARKRFVRAQKSNHWESVLHDIAEWVESEDGDPSVVFAARKYVTHEDDPDLLAKTAASLYRRGILLPAKTNSRQVQVSFDKDGLLLTKAQFSQACKIAGVFTPDVPVWPTDFRVSRELIEQTIAGHPNHEPHED